MNERRITHVEITFFLRMFFVGFDAKYLGVGDIRFGNNRW